MLLFFNNLHYSAACQFVMSQMLRKRLREPQRLPRSKMELLAKIVNDWKPLPVAKKLQLWYFTEFWLWEWPRMVWHNYPTDKNLLCVYK